jgi:uncharacterized protein
MTAPTYGIIIQEVVTAPLPVQSGDFSVIGLLCCADDANQSVFPLNKPVAFNSSDTTFLSEAGTGDFSNALDAINAQLAAFESAATIVAVLVQRGATLAATITNMIGNEGSYTGLYAFMSAGTTTGFIPRLVIAPGYSGMLGVNSITVGAGGSSYTSVPSVVFTPAGASAHAVLTSEVVTSVVIDSPGCYPPGTTVTAAIVGGGGSGATVTLTTAVQSNPYTGYQTYAVNAPVVTAGGSSYTTPPTVVFSPSGATATAVLGTGGTAGEVVGINITSPGSYAPGVTVTGSFTGGGGTGAAFTFSMELLENALCAAMPAVLNSVLGFAYVGSNGDGIIADSINWRQTLSADRLGPSDAWVIETGDGNAPIFSDGVAEAAGAQVAVDFQNAGIPGWSISGHQIQGIIGLKNLYSFSLTDGSTQGQQLLADQISVIEPGAIASDTAIASSGYVWAGVWNASTLPTTWFINQRRMKDFVNLALVKAIRTFIGVDNVTPHSVQAVLNQMTILGSFLLSKQISLGFQVSFIPSENSPTQLSQGQFTVTFANQTPPPITQVTVESTDYPEAFTVELANIIQAASTLSPQFLTS